MARQAKKKRVRKTKPSSTSSRSGVTKSCISFLFSGALIGVLGTLLFQGLQSGSTQDVGSGLRDMMAKSREADAQQQAQKSVPEPVLVKKTKPREKPQFDFYTVLPGFEEVLPKDSPEPPPVKVVKAKPRKGSKVDNKATSKTANKIARPQSASVYVLQVASYNSHADADKLKAELSLRGWPTTIQTVSIDHKTYYRVRVGPFKDYGNMTTVDYELDKMGHKTLRLRLSKG